MQGRAVYFDHNATTPLAPEALEAMLPYLKGQFGNPSSVHRFGIETRYAIEKSRLKIARLLGASKPECIFFTKGGTASINLAIRGAARQARRDRGADVIVTSVAEHHAVLDTCKDLRDREGFRLKLLPVDEWARVRIEDLAKAVDSATAVVSLMHANNETGSLNPLQEIVEKTKEINPLAHVHSDGVQAAGKVALNLDALGVTSYSMAAHKFHGPKSVGILYLDLSAQLESVETGGGQERGLVPGTEDAAAIVGMATALELAVREIDAERVRLESLRESLWRVILGVFPSAVRNSPEMDCLPGTLNVSFSGFSGQRLVAELDRLGFAVSAGSACSSKGTVTSHVIAAMTADPERQAGAVRVSLGKGNTEEEVQEFGAGLRGALAACKGGEK